MVYSWDKEAISAIIIELKEEKEKLETEVKSLDENKKIIAAAFEGEAGEQFQVNLETDIKNTQAVIEMVQEQIQRLKNVRDRHYGECEKILHDEVGRLKAEIV